MSFLPPTTVILAPPPPAMDSSANAHFVYPPPPSFSAMFTIPGLSSCPTLGFQPSILAASSDTDAQSLRTVPPKFRNKLQRLAESRERHDRGLDGSGFPRGSVPRPHQVSEPTFKQKRPPSQFSIVVKGLWISLLPHLLQELFRDQGMAVFLQSFNDDEHFELEC